MILHRPSAGGRRGNQARKTRSYVGLTRLRDLGCRSPGSLGQHGMGRKEGVGGKGREGTSGAGGLRE